MQKPVHDLQPLKSVQYTFNANPYYVWASIVVVWLASLLPWRHWDAAPDVLLVVLAFWAAHRAPGVGMVAAFVFGFVMDVHDTVVLGSTAITYLLTMYGVTKIRKVMMNFDVLGQMVYMLPIFVLAPVPERLLTAWLAGMWGGWSWLISSLFNVALWLVVHLVLKLPWQPIDDDDAVVG